MKPLVNDARLLLQNLSQSAIDDCIAEFNAGNFAYFLEFLPEDETKHLDNGCLEYKRVLTQLYQESQIKDAVAVSRNQLFDLFNYAVGNMPVSPAKFTKLLKHHGLDILPIYINGRTARGAHTKIQVSKETREEAEGALELKKLRSVK